MKRIALSERGDQALNGRDSHRDVRSVQISTLETTRGVTDRFARDNGSMLFLYFLASFVVFRLPACRGLDTGVLQLAWSATTMENTRWADGQRALRWSGACGNVRYRTRVHVLGQNGQNASSSTSARLGLSSRSHGTAGRDGVVESGPRPLIYVQTPITAPRLA